MQTNSNKLNQLNNYFKYLENQLNGNLETLIKELYDYAIANDFFTESEIDLEKFDAYVGNCYDYNTNIADLWVACLVDKIDFDNAKEMHEAESYKDYRDETHLEMCAIGIA